MLWHTGEIWTTKHLQLNEDYVIARLLCSTRLRDLCDQRVRDQILSEARKTRCYSKQSVAITSAASSAFR